VVFVVQDVQIPATLNVYDPAGVPAFATGSFGFDAPGLASSLVAAAQEEIETLITRTHTMAQRLTK
jgi:hypothetical protein